MTCTSSARVDDFSIRKKTRPAHRANPDMLGLTGTRECSAKWRHLMDQVRVSPVSVGTTARIASMAHGGQRTESIGTALFVAVRR